MASTSQKKPAAKRSGGKPAKKPPQKQPIRREVTGGVLLVLVGFYVYQLLTRRQGNGYPAYALPVVFSTLFSVAGAAVWEIYEFSVDSLLGLHTQLGSLYDTMTDIVAGSAGAAVGALVLFGILIGKRRLPR